MRPAVLVCFIAIRTHPKTVVSSPHVVLTTTATPPTQATPEGTSLSFVLDGGSVAVTSSGKAGPALGVGPAAKASLVLYKNDGFTRGDVDAVVESYKAAWGREAAAGAGGGKGGGPGGVLMSFADLLDALRGGQFGLAPEAARDLFGPLLDPSASPSQSPPAAGGGSSSSSSSSSGSSSAAAAPGSSSASVLAPRTTGGSGGGGAGVGFGGAGNDPVSRLRKLGAEVFDKGEAEGLDWCVVCVGWVCGGGCLVEAYHDMR